MHDQIDLPVRVYGKLPLSPEFLHHRDVGEAAGEYHRWINAGYTATAARLAPPRRFSLRTPWLLLLYPDGCRQAIVAVLRDSSDGDRREAGRAFPFSCFVTCPLERLPSNSVAAVETALPVWGRLGQCDRQLTAAGSLSRFHEMAGELQVSLRPLQSAQAAEPSVAEWAAALARDDTRDPRAALIRLLWNVRCAYRRIAAGDIPGPHLPGLRLPLAAGLDAAAQARAWLRCLEISGFFAGRAAPVSLFLPTLTAQDGDLWLLTRPPLPRDFHMLGTACEGHLFPPPEPGRDDSDILSRCDFLDQLRPVLFGEPLPLSAIGRLSLEEARLVSPPSIPVPTPAGCSP